MGSISRRHGHSNVPWGLAWLSVNYGADGLAHRHTHYIASCIQIKNNDRQFMIAAHGDRSGIHYTEALREHFEIGDVPVLDGVGELQGVFVEDTIDAGGFGDYF